MTTTTTTAAAAAATTTCIALSWMQNKIGVNKTDRVRKLSRISIADFYPFHCTRVSLF